MEDKKITVIIPVYNTKKYLQFCVESVIKQTYKNLQIILVDDGSTDGSSTLCDELRHLDTRILVVHKKNEGLGLTRNCGLVHANGEYVTFLDSDDWYEITHIENLVNAAGESTHDVIFGNHTKTSNQGKLLSVISSPYYGEFDEEQIKGKIMFSIIAADDGSIKDIGVPMSVCFNLYKTSIVKEHNISFPSERVMVSEDLFFNLRYLNCCKSVLFTDEAGYYYRSNPNSITRGYDEGQIERTKVFCQQLITCTESLNMVYDVRRRIERCAVAKIRGLLLMIVNSSMNVKSKFKKIIQLLEEPWCREILDNYNIPRYRLALIVTTYFMKKRKYRLLFIVLYMKVKIKKR